MSINIRWESGSLLARGADTGLVIMQCSKSNSLNWCCQVAEVGGFFERPVPELSSELADRMLVALMEYHDKRGGLIATVKDNCAQWFAAFERSEEWICLRKYYAVEDVDGQDIIGIFWYNCQKETGEE